VSALPKADIRQMQLLARKNPGLAGAFHFQKFSGEKPNY
jgi:hypothetical protein